ncbi:MAG: NAD(P)H-hydrate dehydratase, partial [Anaerolineaceae bacterium]|nr:NAD(P)H-hydrate dehydratase [Anaerolineaceae bacterium]
LARILAGKNHKQEKAGIGFVHADAPPASDKVQLPNLVIDADGLKLLARLENWPKTLPQSTVLTPHPGEMSVLTGLTIEEIQTHRMETAMEYASKWGCIVVLKGALTVIAAPDGKTRVIPIATTTLATAGTGDVLAGMITGLIAQKVPSFDAAVAAAYLHAFAGMDAAQQIGYEGSVMAMDVARSIPNAFKECVR